MIVDIFVVQNSYDFVEEAFTNKEAAQEAASQCGGRILRIPLTTEKSD
jgi:hypothetical protein